MTSVAARQQSCRNHRYGGYAPFSPISSHAEIARQWQQVVDCGKAA
jgi:hypothetical protein